MALPPAKFVEACNALYARWQLCDHCGDGITTRLKLFQGQDILDDVRGRDGRLRLPVLRIERTIPSHFDHHDELLGSEAEVEEEDEEAATVRCKDHTGKGDVIYDIVYSPTYLVPTLYVTLQLRHAQKAPSIEKMYEMLVPMHARPQLRSVGVLGGLSRGEHLVTGAPAYFVHPCRTQETMMAVFGDDTSSPERYMMRWIGIIGGPVGLEMPLSVGRSIASDGAGMTAGTGDG